MPGFFHSISLNFSLLLQVFAVCFFSLLSSIPPKIVGTSPVGHFSFWAEPALSAHTKHLCLLFLMLECSCTPGEGEPSSGHVLGGWEKPSFLGWTTSKQANLTLASIDYSFSKTLPSSLLCGLTPRQCHLALQL